jgi:hypothetical protein
MARLARDGLLQSESASARLDSKARYVAAALAVAATSPGYAAGYTYTTRTPYAGRLHRRAAHCADD